MHFLISNLTEILSALRGECDESELHVGNRGTRNSSLCSESCSIVLSAGARAGTRRVGHCAIKDDLKIMSTTSSKLGRAQSHFPVFLLPVGPPRVLS